MEQVTMEKDKIRIPSRFEKMIVDLSDRTRTDELLFTRELEAPSSVGFFIQSDSENEKQIKVISDFEILGRKGNEIILSLGKITGNSSTGGTNIMQAGKYSVYLTSKKSEGKIGIGYQETAQEPSEFERLYKIHKGDLNNPPEEYVEIYSTNLSGLNYKDEVVYTLSVETMKNIGLSVYTFSEQGSVSVDFIGESQCFIGLGNPEHNRICDQLETTLSPGEYQLKLNCENSDGQIYIFLKQ
jgi:hypothetical protein